MPSCSGKWRRRPAACWPWASAPGERVAVYLPKQPETVFGLFGAAAAGACFVPVNPLLKPRQVAYILAHCNVRVLITSGQRLKLLEEVLADCPDLHTVVVVEEQPPELASRASPDDPRLTPAFTGAESGDITPPPHRHRHDRHPLYLRQHRQPQGRGAVPPQYGGGGPQRGQLPGQYPARTGYWRCCR